MPAQFRRRRLDRDLAARPGIEAMESRQLLASFLVTNAQDSGPGSLRQAILDANVAKVASTVAFDIPGSGVHTIALASALPEIHDALAIDATTQPGYAGTPVVAIDGTNAGQADGLSFSSTFSLFEAGSVRGLAIENFAGAGITDATFGVAIQGNYIGVDPSGEVAAGNGTGIINNGSQTTIGGLTAAAGNVISGNRGAGIQVLRNVDAQISYNRIGTGASGRTALGNGTAGISIEPEVIGAAVEFNTIANNGTVGLDDRGTATVVIGNNVSNNGLQIADVGLVATASSVATTAGQPILLTYTLTNRGPHAAGNVRLRLASLSLVSNPDIPYPKVIRVDAALVTQGSTAAVAGITPSGAGTFVAVGTLAPGALAVVTVALSTLTPGRDTLGVSASSDQPSDNSDATASTDISAVGTIDLAVMSLPPPAVAEVGVPLTFSFLVTDRDPRFPTWPRLALDLTGLNGASIASVTTSQGVLAPLPGRTDFYAGDLGRRDLGGLAPPVGLAPGQSAVITVVVVPTRPGPVRVDLASSSPADIDPDPSSNLAIAGALATLSPTVTQAALLPASGAIQSVQLTFDAPLTAAQARDVRNYRLTTNGVRSAIRSAAYDARAHAVTLRLARSLPRLGASLLLVVGGPGSPGLTGADGSKLLGGSDSTTINRG